MADKTAAKPAAQVAAEIASALIGTRTLPPGLGVLQELAKEARAYYRQHPYPLFWFRDWKTEDRGPLPRCLSLPKSIIDRGARWLFGKPIQITVAGNPELEEQLRQAWMKNKMDSRLKAMAIKGAQEGGFVLKLSIDETSEPKFRFQSLSVVDECRLYFHPHDRTQLLMARVQYSYFDATTTKTMWYREEWTDQEEVHYVPVAVETLQGARATPDNYEGWEIQSREPNEFGQIPMVYIRNIETDDVWGAGDLWELAADGNGLLRVIDRINLTYHLMDKSNQFDSELNPIYVDLDIDEQDIDKPLQPGQAIDAESSDDSGTRQGKVIFPPGGNSLRPVMMDYAKDLTKQVMAAASSVYVDQSEFTNKGNLTTAVLEQLYLPQIQITDEKKRTYGDDGLALFLEMVAKAGQKLGIPLGVVEGNDDTFDVQLQFAPYFQPTPDEMQATTQRTQQEETAGYLPHDRAVERIAQQNGIHDVGALKEELASEQQQKEADTNNLISQVQDMGFNVVDPDLPLGAQSSGGGNQ